MVLVSGPGGIGKSTLLREIVRRAADRGRSVVSIDGRELGPDPGRLETVLRKARALADAGQPVVVDVAIDYSRKTYFTAGVVRTNLARLPWPDRIRMIARAVWRGLQPAEREP